MSWEALPPRRKQRRVDAMTSTSKPVEVATINAVDTENEEKMRKENIKDLLAATDGCPGEFYEYLDHTADIQLHSWGCSMSHAFENIVPCMFNYITALNRVNIDEHQTITIDIVGHDIQSLLFNYLDEFLFRFSTEGFVSKEVKVVSLVTDPENDSFSLSAQGFGCTYDKEIHNQGTEIKAITYSNMQIHSTIESDQIYLKNTSDQYQYKEPYACICCNPEQSLPYIECQVINKPELLVDKNRAVNIFVIVDI